MPLVELQCTKCGLMKDAIFSFNDVPETGATVKAAKDKLTECEKCNGDEFKRVPSEHGKRASWSNW